MGWARFDDAYTDHPKVVSAGPLAELLDMRAILFSARYETDGHIPPAQLARIGVGVPAVKKRVAALVEVGRWHEPGHECKDCPQVTDGWVVHDYLDYNPSREQQAEKREHARRRYSMNMDPELRAFVQERDGGLCRYCAREVNWRDRRSDQGGTYDHVVPLSEGGDESAENIVTACRGCNQRKGPRTPSEAGMVLLEPRSTSKSDLDVGPKPDPAQHKTPVPSPTRNPKTPENQNPASPNGDAPKPRKPDPLFDAMVTACSLNPDELTASARGRINKALKELRDVGASPEGIQARADVHRQRWPNAELTPSSLAANYAQLGTPARTDQQRSPPSQAVSEFTESGRVQP